MIGTGVQYYGVRFDMGYSFGLLERSNEGIKNVLDVQKARYETVLVGHFFVGLSYSFLNDIYNK